MSFVDVKNLEPSKFEEKYYDEYEYYNLTDKYTGKKYRLYKKIQKWIVTFFAKMFFFLSLVKLGVDVLVVNGNVNG